MEHCTQSRFRKSLYDPHDFTLTFELVPSRGGRSHEHNRTLELARALAGDGRLQALSITENAGGHAALSPDVLGSEIRELGRDVIVHFSCKDKNRNQMESQLFAWDRLGLCDLLIITGDYPKKGYSGFPKPVFDLDSVHALDLIRRMNSGQFGLEPYGSGIQATSFLQGVAVSPFKRSESELMMQYFKLHRKVAAGADYVITQVGFDARKFHEVLQYMRQHDLKIPVLGNVFVPNLTVTELMYRGEIPGCVIPDRLYQQIINESRSPDKGKRARLERAAKLLAVLKGIGYDGAHIGGPRLSRDDIAFILDESEQCAESWQGLVEELSYWHEGGFYCYQKDAASGLNSPEPASSAGRVRTFFPAYRAACKFHDLAFEPDGPLFGPFSRVCLALEETRLGNPLLWTEHLLKFLAFGCQNCGDCTLASLAFLCPQYGCAKYLLNGPCGGSRDGWCEVYPGRKRCLYVKVYERLRSSGRENEMRTEFVPPRDWSLNNSSSWINFYQGRDNSSKQQAAKS